MIPIVAIMIGYNLKKEKPLHPIWLILSSIVFIATNSRWVYLNLIVILIQYLLVKGINLKKVLKISFLIILGISSIYILLQFSGYNINSFIEERLLAKSAASRFLALEMFTKFFPKNPFFGTGIHVAEDLRRAISGRSSQIHVGYLSHLYEYGLVGSYFLFGAWFLITRNFHRVAKQTGYYGSLFAFIAFLVGNLTLVIYSVYCYGLLFAFIFNKMMNDTET